MKFEAVRKIILLFALIGAFFHPCSALGLESSKVGCKVSLGYDNLIVTHDNSKISQTFSNFHLDSKLSLFPHPKRLDGVFRFQNGFKVISEHENISFNQGDLGFALFISPRVSSEILCEVKRKDISAAQDISIQGEYGYLYWHSGASLKYSGNDLTSSIRYLHRQRSYAEESFADSKSHQIQLMTNAFVSNTLTACLTGTIETSRLSGQQQESSLKGHNDTLYELSVGSQWLDDFLINPSYAFQWNTSDHSEYAFNAQQFSILAALPLYWEITLQCYGKLQICKYTSHHSLPSAAPDEDNTDQSHNVLVFSLSRDILKSYSLETRYLFSRTGGSSASEKYEKQSCSLTITYLF